MGAIVEGLAGRLGEVEAELADGLAQIRLAFVQVQAGRRQDDGQG
jgi:adenylate cyclase